MNGSLQKLIMVITLFFLLMLTGCIGFGCPLDAADQEKTDEQIRESIEKTFPLPGNVFIKTHVGNDLRFSTVLSVEEVVAFYRDEYIQRGYIEEAGSQIMTDSATILFRQNGEKNVLLEVTKNENGCDVHIKLKPART
jgi:hypothetical protein